MSRPDSTSLERLVLFLAAFRPEHADRLLKGLCRSQSRPAAVMLARVQGWDSETRKGRLAFVFGERPDASEWLHRELKGATVKLRQSLAERLPPHLARTVGTLPRASSSGSVTPLHNAVVERLVREVVRR